MGENFHQECPDSSHQSLATTLSERTSPLKNFEPSFRTDSTTCPHCVQTLPKWNAIATRNNNDQCTIVGISLSRHDETGKYYEKKDVRFYVVSIADTNFRSTYKIVGVPETILIKGNGEVENVWIGELTDDHVKEIETILGI